MSVYLTKEQIDAAVTVDKIISLKHSISQRAKDKALLVKFTKSDGTERVMRCSLRKQDLPPTDPTTLAIDAANAGTRLKRNPDDYPNVLAVWDLDAAGWRSFRINSILEVRILEAEAA